MNKIASIKTTSIIFLAIVLVTGTITAIFPSFIIKGGVNAQAETEGPQSQQGERDFNGTQGQQGIVDPNQIPLTKIYRNVEPVVFTSPGNSSTGFATTTATCNTGDTAISSQEVIIPLVRNFFPGSGGPFESFGGSYISGFASFSNPPSNNA